MSARIMVDLDYVHPVTGDNVSHRPKRLLALPQPGDQIWFLCGLRETAVYVGYDPNAVILTCWRCDYVYRRREGMPIPPNHPGRPDNQRKPSPDPRNPS